MPTGSGYVWIEVDGPIETSGKAVLVQPRSRPGPLWLPISQIGARKTDPQTKRWTKIEIPRWLAENEKLVPKAPPEEGSFLLPNRYRRNPDDDPKDRQ